MGVLQGDEIFDETPSVAMPELQVNMVLSGDSETVKPGSH